MKIFLLRKMANLGLSFLLEHRDFFIQVSSTALNWWKGKKLAILGPQGSGKDALWNRLQGLSPHDPLVLNEGRIPQFKIDFNLSDGRKINLTCKRSLNIGGEEVSAWKEVCDDCDVIFYIITIDDLLSKKYEGGRIKKDIEWFHKTFPFLKKASHLHILINKIDSHIKDYTEYDHFKKTLEPELYAFNQFVSKNLDPWDKKYTGSTLTSTYDEHIYLKAMERVFSKVYQAIHSDK